MSTPSQSDRSAARYVHYVLPEAIKPTASGNDLADALKFVLDGLHREHAARMVDQRASNDGAEPALLFVPSPSTALVVGASAFATQIRALLADGGINGWCLHQLPDDTTPLHTLQPHLSTRYYGLLARNGFAAVEEVAAVPDRCLMTLRNAGPKFVAQVRHIIGGAESHSPPVLRPSKTETAAERLTYLEESLEEPAVLRYREFITALSRTSIPTAALDKITDALNSEPLPPADPTVTLLLDTAGEPHLLDIYRRTHEVEEKGS